MSDTANMFKVRTSDGIDFDVSLQVAEQIGLIQGWLQQERMENNEQCCSTDNDEDNIIILDRVRSEIFQLVLKWCAQLQELSIPTQLLEDNKLKSNLFKAILEQMNADDSTMFELIIAADFLNIESLFHAGASYVAGLIAACDSVKEIRERFVVTASDDSEDE